MKSAIPAIFSLIVIAMGCEAVMGDQPVAIVNPGFEEPVMSLCGFNNSITGWTVTSGGVWHPGAFSQCLHSFLNGPPEGAQVGYTNGDNISQVLTATLQPLLKYKLTVQVGRRADCCMMQGYKVQLLAGTTVLAEDPGSLNPPNGTWQLSTVTFAAPTNHPALGQPLKIILLHVGGGQADFDDVHLTTTTGDCNTNGILDSIDIANGTSQDVNGNGIPDECEGLCAADIAPQPNGNGVVNVDDLLMVINNWGPCAPGSCAADIAPAGGNGVVNVDDLLAVINAWGPCP